MEKIGVPDKTHPIKSPEPQKGVFNISSRGETETERVLSNLTHAPFELDSKCYESVEGFWQGLKFSEGGQKREKIANLAGKEAKYAGKKAKNVTEFEYHGKKNRSWFPKTS